MTAEWLLNQASVCINNSSGGRRELCEAAVLEAERKWASRAGCQRPCIMMLPPAPGAEAKESRPVHPRSTVFMFTLVCLLNLPQ